MSESIDTHKHETLVVENLLKTASDLDRIMLEAVEAGMETGRSIGVIEAYNVLVNEGYVDAAEALMDLINEEAETRMARGDA
jgi:hypothetical protein